MKNPLRKGSFWQLIQKLLVMLGILEKPVDWELEDMKPADPTKPTEDDPKVF